MISGRDVENRGAGFYRRVRAPMMVRSREEPDVKYMLLMQFSAAGTTLRLAAHLRGVR
ncbi:hypothetical protein DER29_0452 [Micromonospora sp. M71_S20]|nr:hypothetical protein DER29_0452 [Micromonospora sp. M71_S20]